LERDGEIERGEEKQEREIDKREYAALHELNGRKSVNGVLQRALPSAQTPPAAGYRTSTPKPEISCTGEQRREG